MWISQTEFEDEESLELINKLNSNRQIQDEELDNILQSNVLIINLNLFFI